MVKHHPANQLYSIIILSHPFSTPGPFSSHVLQPTEPYPSLHHVFEMTFRLNSTPFLYLPHRHYQSQDIRLLYLSPRAFHSKLKSHLFKLSYPDPSDHSPSPPEQHQP